MTTNAYRRSLYTSAVQVTANVLMLAAVFVAMYQSSSHPSESLTVFCIWFFSMTIFFWIIARRLIRFIRRRYADSDEGLVRLPGTRREILMRWKVCPQIPVLERLSIQS